MRESTKLLADDPNDTAKAKAMRALLEAAEHKAADRALTKTDGWAWVLPWLNGKHKAATLQRAQGRWKYVALFLEHRKLFGPEKVVREDAERYLHWRVSLKKRSGKVACHNTARGEVVLLGQVLGEAVYRRKIPHNPFVRLGLRREDPKKEKPEINDEELAQIRAGLKEEAEWMSRCFEISWATGCRLRETAIPVECLDFAVKIIHFPNPKGGKKRAFSVPMPSNLEGMLKEIVSRGEKVTVKFPPMPSRQWQHAFRRMGLPHLTFHCARVSYVTRLARACVPLQAAMRLVNHSSELVHRAYSRLNVEDLRVFVP